MTQKSSQSKSAEWSDNNSGSNDEDDKASIGLNIRDGSDNGSGTQVLNVYCFCYLSLACLLTYFQTYLKTSLSYASVVLFYLSSWCFQFSKNVMVFFLF